jgi:hypothetical protein
MNESFEMYLEQKMFQNYELYHKAIAMFSHNEGDKLKHCMILADSYLIKDYIGIFNFHILLSKGDYKSAADIFEESYLDCFEYPKEVKRVLLPYLL